MGSGGNLPIGPGFAGFVAFFLMAVALWLLVRNMSGRLRRMAYRERERELNGSDRDTTLGTASDDRTTGADDTQGTDGPGEAPEPRP